MPGRKHAAGGVLDMFKACGVDAWPRGDFARVGDSSVAVVRRPSLVLYSVFARWRSHMCSICRP